MKGMISSCNLCIEYTIKHFVSLSKVCVLQATVHRGNLATVHYNGVGMVDARHTVYCKGVCVHYKGVCALEVTVLRKQFLSHSTL